jgi:hypothetical protein
LFFVFFKNFLFSDHCFWIWACFFPSELGEAIKQGKTGYCPAAGIQPLREALAEGLGKARGGASDIFRSFFLPPTSFCVLMHYWGCIVEYTYENVSVQSGGKPIIGKFLMSVMEEGDEVRDASTVP